jgi:hypothetical protein
MSDFASVLERTQEAFASVARLERALAAAPSDSAIQINLRSKQRLAERFQELLYSAAEKEHVDICRYRLVPNTQNNYAVTAVARSLERFQDLFSMIYDALTNGVRRNARLGAAIAQQTSLEFAYSYPGSLGILLTVQGGRDIFSGKFDDSIDAIHQLFGISDRHEVIGLARALGNSVVKRAYDWSMENFKGDFSVDLTWRKSDGRHRGALIDRTQIARMVDIIGLTSEESKETIPVRGILVGADVKTRSFHFVVPDGESYRGALGPDFPAAGTIEVGRRYSARIIVRTVIKYATETEEKKFTLESLETDSSA